MWAYNIPPISVNHISAHDKTFHLSNPSSEKKLKEYGMCTETHTTCHLFCTQTPQNEFCSLIRREQKPQNESCSQIQEEQKTQKRIL